MQRIHRRLILATCLVLVCFAGVPIRAAEPITITLDDITNKPWGYPLPPFLWRGVWFSGGRLYRHSQTLNVYYKVEGRSWMQLEFPAGSTDISFDAAGQGGTIYLPDKMPINVWHGSPGSGTLITTLPYPPQGTYKVTIPGPASLITLYSAPAPSGIREIYNEIYLDNIRYTPPDPDPTIAFDSVLPEHTKVLTHNYGEASYPSPLQTQDGAIRVEGTVRLNGQLAPGKTIHFRVTDPPDTAPYVPPSAKHSNDNFDGPGSLNGSGPTATAVSDGAGRISVTLRVSSFAAGDNYQIEASPNANFTCAASCAKSAVYTAWKRVYMEVDRMFRRGAYITEDIPANADYIIVSDLSQFQSGDVVRVIHAPRLQAKPPASAISPLELSEFFYSEDHVVDVVSTPTVLPDGAILPPHLKLRAGDQLGASFGVDRSFASTAAAPPVPYLRDAVGVIAAGFYEPDVSLIGGSYATMYLEAVPASNSVSEIPREPWVSLGMVAHFGNKWFEHGQRTSTGSVIPQWNHVQIAGGSRNDQPSSTSATTGAQLGQTPMTSGHYRSWIWGGRIELAVAEPAQNVFGLSSSYVKSEVTLHEAVHQWRVNPIPPAASVQTGHCLAQRYQQDNKYCLMHAPFYDPQHNPELGDGLGDLHYTVDASGKVDSEYIHIRRQAEPFVE